MMKQKWPAIVLLIKYVLHMSDDWAECGLFAQQQILRDSNWGKLGGIREIQATIARGLECRQKPGRATDEMAAQITPGRLTQHPN